MPILVSTWNNGLFSLTGKTVHQNFPGQTVRGLTADGRSGALAIVGGHALCRRSPDGQWITIAKSEFPLSCCVPVGNAILVGTEDANILRVDPDGTQHRLAGFDTVEGRDTWYAGSAIVNGKRMGPPLGIRSITATSDGTLLANVHVGGIPRSTDDIHQVCAHPTRPDIVIAAAAVGFCMSRDGGATWAIEQQGLHAAYCSAVAFGRNEVLVAASADHFAPEGAVYRRPLESNGPLQLFGGGMPPRLNGIADTDCIATRDSMIAVVDRAGSVYVSQDDGAHWSQPCDPVPMPSALLLT